MLGTLSFKSIKIEFVLNCFTKTILLLYVIVLTIIQCSTSSSTYDQ